MNTNDTMQITIKVKNVDEMNRFESQFIKQGFKKTADAYWVVIMEKDNVEIVINQ